MQLSNGTVTMTNASTRVIASAYTDWSAVQTALGQGSPVLFSLFGTTEVPRQVVSVTTPGNSGSGNWELTLAVPWNSGTQIGASYFIHTDFTPGGLPLASAGDRGWSQLFSMAMIAIEAKLAQGAPTANPTTNFAPIQVVLGAGQYLIVSGELNIPPNVEIVTAAGGAVHCLS